ncbi:MAG: ATP-dependent DNA helicase RecG [Rickettsiella sp.]|nr:ATP-dependent DNA helicase RecG [Rickettsiella sp.]
MKDLAQLKCEILQGVGPKIANYLIKCSIHSLQDLLFHLPYRYENRSKITPINQAKPQSSLLIRGIIQPTIFKSRKGYSYRLQDETGSLVLRFFHLTRQQRQAFKIGASLLCFGEVRTTFKKPFELEMVHPDYQFLKPNTKPILPAYLTAIYPSTQGLSQRTWHKLIHQVLTLLAVSSKPNTKQDQLVFLDYLPKTLLKTMKLPDLIDAITYLHKPPLDASLDELISKKHNMQQRLILEELLAHSLSIRAIKKNRSQETAPTLTPQHQLTKRFLIALPFKLTTAQQRVIQEISTDIEKPYPMQRLLQGDVGSGKTVVAAFAGTQAIENHYQVALMAPTELLSEQHYQHFHRWLTPLGCHVVSLRSKLKVKTKRHILSEIENGKAQIVIGTHALFQENVKFAKLGLIIIDEQHRFGVQQRLSLWKKGQRECLQAHQLFMTATPIPRTLAMTSLTDLDISFLDELPPGRLPVQTIVLSSKHRPQVIARVHNSCIQKKQAYWVCPLIEESDSVYYEAVEAMLKTLQSYLPDLRLELIHGRLGAHEKETIMRKFKDGDIDLLVATSVIEVGVDIGNANLMIIENAERLGLAQLHQLRGRVGRSTLQSYCVLLYERLSPIAKKRLSIMRKSQDGFMIAQHDLELRGPGEIWGLRQTGWQQLHIADLNRDYYLLPMVQKLSDAIVNQHPYLIGPLIQRWIKHNNNAYFKT